MPRPIPKINGRQVNLLLALFSKAGMYKDTSIMEWIEYNCGIELKCLEDVDVGNIDSIIVKLRKSFNID